MSRETFNEVPLLYHEVRPNYPDELFTVLVEITGLTTDSTLLEIGPGTGQATTPLAEKGFKITAIELGASLAEFARYQLRDFQNVQILHGAFEETILSPKSFDLVYAATAFHWIDPSVKYSKTHEILKDKGHLAIIHTNHVSDQVGDKFFNEAQPIYDRHNFVDKNQTPKLPDIGEISASEIDERLFKTIHFQIFPIAITYTAKNFAKLLNTFSNHLSGEKDVQLSFYHDIENLITAEFGGFITRHFGMSLTIAEKI